MLASRLYSHTEPGRGFHGSGDQLDQNEPSSRPAESLSPFQLDCTGSVKITPLNIYKYIQTQAGADRTAEQKLGLEKTGFTQEGDRLRSEHTEAVPSVSV